MDFCPGIEINDPFLTSFSENNAFPFIEIDVIAAKGNHLTNTHSGGRKKVYHRILEAVFRLALMSWG